MTERKLNLSREQIKQLSDANAEMLEKKIMDLQILSKDKNLNYKQFWKKSEDIHTLFKKISPLEKSERRKLWSFFEEVREVVKKRQSKEKEIEKFVLERLTEEISFLISEIREIISKENREFFEVEILLFSLEQLKSAIKGDISLLPDTPDKSFVSFRLKNKIIIEKNLQKEAIKNVKEAEKWLKNLSDRKFEEIKSSLENLENEISKMDLTKIKKVLKSVTNEILGPCLVKQQKEELLKQVNLFYDKIEKGKKEEKVYQEKKNDKKGDKPQVKIDEPKSKKIDEIRILLEELEQSVLKQS